MGVSRDKNSAFAAVKLHIFDGVAIKTKRGVVITTSPRLDNKPIIITFLAMEKVIMLLY